MKEEKTTLQINENIEALLCYAVVWVSGIVLLIFEKKSQIVRFHAMQSILVFLPLSVLTFIFQAIPIIGTIIGDIILPLLAFVLWIFLMVMAYKGEKYKIPFVGHLAEVLLKNNK